LKIGACRAPIDEPTSAVSFAGMAQDLQPLPVATGTAPRRQ
jgi:hypothetical protein